jgi:hypothetical protein
MGVWETGGKRDKTNKLLFMQLFPEFADKGFLKHFFTACHREEAPQSGRLPTW